MSKLHNITKLQDNEATIRPGQVKLVGFGPGDPDLLTVKAVKAIEAADIIFYDDLISKDYLEQIDAEKVYVGKRSGHHSVEQRDINQLLLQAAKAGKEVVRLKGGDPMLFAHAGEEIEFLESYGITVSVIPGITTASAMASSLKVSLTHRQLSSSVALVNGHSNRPETPNADTLVYYMGAAKLPLIARTLLGKGKSADTPVILVYNVSHADEQRFETTIGELATDIRVYPTPLIALVGDVVATMHQRVEDIVKARGQQFALREHHV